MHFPLKGVLLAFYHAFIMSRYRGANRKLHVNVKCLSFSG